MLSSVLKTVTNSNRWRTVSKTVSISNINIIRRWSDEVKRAQKSQQTSGPSIFERIASREIPADIIYEDKLCIAIKDVVPQAPVHLLVVPKRKIATLQETSDSDQELLGHLLLVARKLGGELAPRGWRVVINNGVEGAQSVYHIHVHVLGGRQMEWPPG